LAQWAVSWISQAALLQNKTALSRDIEGILPVRAFGETWTGDRDASKHLQDGVFPQAHLPGLAARNAGVPRFYMLTVK
jgi:hypothetical protein